MDEQRPSTPPQLPATSTGDGSTARIIYVLYLVGLLVGVTGIVGVIMAYVNQGQSQAWVQTHYRFQIRTFWILLLYSVIAVLLTLVVIGLVLWPLIAIWFIVRCAKGLMLLEKQQPVPAPATWLW